MNGLRMVSTAGIKYIFLARAVSYSEMALVSKRDELLCEMCIE